MSDQYEPPGILVPVLDSLDSSRPLCPTLRNQYTREQCSNETSFLPETFPKGTSPLISNPHVIKQAFTGRRQGFNFLSEQRTTHRVQTFKIAGMN